MKKRVLSAAVLIAVFIPLLIIGGWAFSIAAGIVGILSYKEVVDLRKKDHDLPSLIKIIGVIGLLVLIYLNTDKYFLYTGIEYKTIGILILAFLIPTIFYGRSNDYTTKDAFYMIGWTLLLGIFFNTLILMVNSNVLYFVFLLLITIMNDTFALIFGKLIGAHKMIPSVSPNKTWEGSICGLVLGSFIASVYYYNVINPNINIMKLIVIVLTLSIIGQIGDLVFSKIKRENRIKDFSNIIPGHGGILDRLDSIIFVVIAFLLMLKMI